MHKQQQRALLALVLAGSIALAFVYRDQIDATTLEERVASAGMAGPLLFMALYAIATVLFLPGSPLALAGSALFGPPMLEVEELKRRLKKTGGTNGYARR